MIRLLALALVAVALLAAFAPDASADTIRHEITNGTDSGVSYSWLTSGSSTTGVLGSDDAKWRISGTVDFTYDAAGHVTGIVGGAATIDVLEGGVVVGNITFTAASLDATPESDATLDADLGTFTITLVATDASSDFASRIDTYGGIAVIGFDNTNYYGSDFNSFDSDSMYLWGNELVADGSIAEAGNWGFDWGSLGTPVPEPGTIVLFGIGLVGVGGAVRRRRAAP